MNNVHDIYLENLGVGEIWQLRQASVVDGVEDSPHLEIAQSAAPMSASAIPDVLPTPWQKLQLDVQLCQACTLCAQYGKGEVAINTATSPILVLSDWSKPNISTHSDPIVQKIETLMSNVLSALSTLLAQPRQSHQTPASGAIYHASLLKAQLMQDSQLRFDATAESGARQCVELLRRQIALLQPRILLVFGERVGQILLGDDAISLAEMRRTPAKYAGIPVVVTYDAQHLLNFPESKYEVWQDLCRIQGLNT